MTTLTVYGLFKMSLFKEKDDIIVSAFRKFDSDSDEEINPRGNIRTHNSIISNDISIDDDADDYKKVENKIAFDVSGDRLGSEGLLKTRGDSRPIDGQQTPPVVCIDSDDDSGGAHISPKTRSKTLRNSKRKAKARTRSKARAKAKALAATKKTSNEEPPQEVISISSDEESTSIPNLPSYATKLADLSQDPDDRNFSLKLSLSGTFKQFRTTYKACLSDILKDLINDLQSQGKELIITYKCKTVELGESPHSLNLSSGDILDAIEVSNKSIAANPVNSPDEITVKVQDGNRKHTKEFRIFKNRPIVHLKQRYRKEFNLPDDEPIKLMFDGDLLDDESTPEELDIEDDCIIDVMVQ